MAEVRAAGLDKVAAQPTPGTRADGPLTQALAAILGASLLMSFNDVAAKSLFDHVSIWEFSMLRGLGAITVVSVVAVVLSARVRLRTRAWPFLALRGLLMFTAFTLFFSSMPYMTIVEATALFFTAPLIITVLSALYLGESVGVLRLSAVAVGFAGAVLVTGWTPDQPPRLAYLLPLGCAVAYGHAVILTRGIKGQISPWSFSLWNHIMQGSLSILGWIACQHVVPPFIDQGMSLNHLVHPLFSVQWGDLWLLAPIVLAASFSHVLSAHAYRSAPVSIVTPFEYTYLLWAALIAYVLLGEVPAPRAVAGLALIAGAGLFVAYRENVRARRARPS
jgi:drug/metabolite transporter (DMT)-like permease